MKVVFKRVEKDGTGDIKLIAEEPEDMWHAYNLIVEGDLVTATTFRKITKQSATGSTTAHKVKIKVTIKVESVDFDAVAGEMRLQGKNTEQNQYINIGQYHTLELETHRAFVLHKEAWDSIHFDRISEACNPASKADLAVVLMQPGLANLIVVTPHMSSTVLKLESNIPRKRLGSSTRHDKGIQRFFGAILEGIRRHLNFDVLKCVILAGPGFVKDDFFTYLKQQIVKDDDRMLMDNRSKFLLVGASSGHRPALKEILDDPSVQSMIQDTKAARDVALLRQFFDMLKIDPDRAYYGPAHVLRAHEANAIDTLLLTDDLFRSSNITERKRYVALVDEVKEGGGDVAIFSSMHTSGEQLKQMTGIAAILRFPMPDVEDSDSSDE